MRRIWLYWAANPDRRLPSQPDSGDDTQKRRGKLKQEERNDIYWSRIFREQGDTVMSEKSLEERAIERPTDLSESRWFQVPGDLDDLIFYDAEVSRSER